MDEPLRMLSFDVISAVQPSDWYSYRFRLQFLRTKYPTLSDPSRTLSSWSSSAVLLVSFSASCPICEDSVCCTFVFSVVFLHPAIPANTVTARHKTSTRITFFFFKVLTSFFHSILCPCPFPLSSGMHLRNWNPSFLRAAHCPGFLTMSG